MTEDSISKLLSVVWGNHEGYVFLPYKDLAHEWHEPKGIAKNGGVPSFELPTRVDQYFCPVVFSEPRRKKEFALPTNLLWADLDPVHPEKCRLRPSIAWESSPGRYQALWFLTTDIPAEDAANLSKRIAYADGADKGGWDVTQVLRVPGTRNYKYDSHPPVKLLWANRSGYSLDEIRGAYPPVNGEATPQLENWPEVSELQIQSELSALPVGLRLRITKKREGADRSLELQKLARDLLKHGTSPELVTHLLQRSVFNKFAGRADEHRQLMKQVSSALAAVAEAKAKATKPELVVAHSENDIIEAMRVHSWNSFMSTPTTLNWLVEDSWIDRTVGFISGRSKSYKTWIALDLGLSILSGTPFLDRFLVGRTGPVILVQEEDPMPVLQERIRLIGKRKHMLPSAEYYPSDQKLKVEYPEYPLHIINLQGFNLSSVERTAQLRQLIAEVDPVLVILDPLVVMLGNVDEYRATEVSGLLQTIKFWREEFGCSIAVVHHWNKGKSEDGERGGQHMYGSFAFHAWLESALHVTPVVDDQEEKIDTVIIEREFKAAPSGRALKVKFEIDSVKEYTYLPVIEASTESPIAIKLLDLINQTPGISTPELVAVSGYSRPRVSEAASALVRANRIRVERGGGRGNSSKFFPVE